MIDCDVHDEVPGVQALFPYLSTHWVEYCRQSAFRGPSETSYPPHAPTSRSPLWRDAEPRAASSVEAVREQLLDPLEVDLAILTCTYAVESIHNPDTAAAISSAVNHWQRIEWLDREPRLRASIVVPSSQPEMAAAEIDRVAGDPRFVQVVVPVRSAMPYGNRHFHPLFEAAARHGLVVAMHFGGAPGNPPTGSGWPSYYVEDMVGMAQVFQTQLLSLIAEGTFDRFPELRVACVEGGFTWVPSLLWRLDKEWKGLRRTCRGSAARPRPTSWITSSSRRSRSTHRRAWGRWPACWKARISSSCCCSRPTTPTGISTRWRTPSHRNCRRRGWTPTRGRSTLDWKG